MDTRPDGTAWQDHVYDDVAVRTFEHMRTEFSRDDGTQQVYRVGAYVDGHVPLYAELTADPTKRTHTVLWGSDVDFDGFYDGITRDTGLGQNPDVVVIPPRGDDHLEGTFFDYRHVWDVDEPSLIEFAHGIPDRDAPHSDYYSRGWSEGNSVNQEPPHKQVVRRDARSGDIVQKALPHVRTSTDLTGEEAAAALLAVTERMDGQDWI